MAQVLRPLIDQFRPEEHPNLIGGISDDAAVYRLDAETAIVQTVDFFPPVVDDAWTYGAIAAANAMSDVYAMGAEVVLCLNVAGFPEDFSPETMTKIFQGGADKVAEGGGVVAGGHTLIDAEPKYGMSVMGLVHPDRILAKTGALPGDALVLAKALGTGLILTAAKRDLAQPDELSGAVAGMLKLNRHAMHLALEAGAHAMTDVTGFGICGHALEIADHSQVQVVLRPGELPLLPGALKYATAGLDFGGVNRNSDYLAPRVQAIESVELAMQRLLFDPQTSGGLLIAVDQSAAPSLTQGLQSGGYDAAIVGEVHEGEGLRLET